MASMNTSANQTQASYKRLEALMAEKKAQLWINHDKPQSEAQKRSPQSTIEGATRPAAPAPPAGLVR